MPSVCNKLRAFAKNFPLSLPSLTFKIQLYLAKTFRNVTPPTAPEHPPIIKLHSTTQASCFIWVAIRFLVAKSTGGKNLPKLHNLSDGSPSTEQFPQ